MRDQRGGGSNPEKGRRPKGWEGPKGGGQRGGGPKRGRLQISSFFFPLPPPFRFFFFSLGFFSWNFGVVFEGGDPQSARLGPRAVVRDEKRHEKTTREREKRHEKTPEREKKANMEAGEGKTARN